MTTTSKVGLTDKFRRPATKVCRLCEKELPIKKFNLSIKGRFGYTNECRDCKKEHEANKEQERKEKARNFFDAKFFTLLVFLTTSLTAFSQVIDTRQPLRQFDVSKWGHVSTGVAVSATRLEPTPDTLRAICLVTLGYRNLNVAHARMGFVVIEQGKRPVYLDCRRLGGGGKWWIKRKKDDTKSKKTSAKISRR